MAPGSIAVRFPPGQQPPGSDWHSRLERLERYAAEREAIIAALTTELHREPTAKERLMIEAAASSIVEARRLRRRGRSTRMQDRNTMTALRALGLGQYTGVRKPKSSPDEARNYLSGVRR